VQCDEAAREAVALEIVEVAVGRVEGMRIDALDLSASSTPPPESSEISRSAE
jgi:hypothetical protein